MKTIFSVFIAILAIGFTACTHSSGSGAAFPIASAFADSLPGSCPNLIRDDKGNIVLSWVREVSDSSAVFCYAVSTDGGRSFEKPVAIPPSGNIRSHSENLPRVLFKPSGEVLAVWGAASGDPRNKYSGKLFYAQSFDGGQSWGMAKPLVSDRAGYDQRYFDVALLPDGEAAIIWLDNRKSTGSEGSALYLASTSGKEGFGGEKRIAQPCCPCCRTDLFVDHKGGIHALYRGIIQDSIRDMVHVVSTDGGGSFSAPKRIANDNWVLNACPHTGPAMTENTKGLHFAWYTGGGLKGSFYTRSTNNGSSFMMHDSVAYAGKHPQLAAGESGELVIVWDEPIQVGKDFYSRIGIQQRTAEGRGVKKWFLTPGDANASYPVIAKLKSGAFLVAYCQEKNGKSYVAYQPVNVL